MSDITATSPGLLTAALADAGLGALVDSIDAATLRVEGPAALRPLVAGALARADGVATTLAVCATEREAEDLGTA
ncbi:MAG: hypothetical protein J2P20_19935, partial [Pseudonocardia sp.]|nr:hypothetical protein [Pseudonocardia sp.]